jgi:hypothetical protein
MQATDYDPKDNSAHSRMWRSESFDEGEWVLVYDSGEGLGHDMASFTVVGDDLWSGNLTSSDDGLSWSEITTWR